MGKEKSGAQRVLSGGRKRNVTTLLPLIVTMLAVCPHPATSAEWVFQILHEFSRVDGGPWHPGSLVQGSDGCFYATSSAGGNNNLGTVFRLAPNGQVSTVTTLSNSYWLPEEYGLTEGVDGLFYGSTYLRSPGNPGAVLQITPDISPYILSALVCPPEIRPYGRLLQMPDGKFYGTSFDGGQTGAGLVFSVTTNGTFQTVVLFTRTNGWHPQCGLILGADGALYGSTTGGGGPSGDAYGTIFRLTTDGVLTTLHTFDYAIDGSLPSGNLLQACDGNFYGTTEYGIDSDFGTVFKMTPGGVLTTLVNLNGTNGSYPHGDLIQAGDGYIYGRTVSGGTDDNGTLFSLTTNGVFTTLLKFQGTNGNWPWPAMVLGKDGNIYGTADGGTEDAGIAYRLVPSPMITGICYSNDLVTLTWTSFTNGLYRVEQSTNLNAAGWVPLASDITASGNSTTLNVPPTTAGHGFYRIALQPWSQ